MASKLALGCFIRALETAEADRFEDRSRELKGFSEVPKTEACSRAESLTRTSEVIASLSCDLAAIERSLNVAPPLTLIGIKGHYNGEKVLVISLPVSTVRTFKMEGGEILRILPINHKLFAALKQAAEDAETSCMGLPCSQLEINHYQLSY